MKIIPVLEHPEEEKIHNMNPGRELDIKWVNSTYINEAAVNRSVIKFTNFLKLHEFDDDHEIAWLLRAVSCIDLTTLGGDDTDSNVQRLCRKARKPLSCCLLEFPEIKDFQNLKTAAVCVYPSRVSAAVNIMEAMTRSDNERAMPVASVASGFPSGQYPIETRLQEIEYCVNKGATEIDIVISRELVLTEQWEALYREIKSMKEKCRGAHLKTILATGECATLTNVYKASLIAMMAGSDFIKTSTGKEAVNATFPVGIVMCRAIFNYYLRTGIKVGFKPAGGIRTSNDALAWLMLINQELGKEWLSSDLFRIGASGLLTDIEKRLYFLLKGEDANPRLARFTI